MNCMGLFEKRWYSDKVGKWSYIGFECGKNKKIKSCIKKYGIQFG